MTEPGSGTEPLPVWLLRLDRITSRSLAALLGLGALGAGYIVTVLAPAPPSLIERILRRTRGMGHRVVIGHQMDHTPQMRPIRSRRLPGSSARRSASRTSRSTSCLADRDCRSPGP